jgi:anaerobic selenocysteine-containing dehydrogenase
VAQLPAVFAGEGRRVLLHPLPLYNNSFGLHDMGLMRGPSIDSVLSNAGGGSTKALYIAGSLLPEQIQNHADSLSALDFLCIQELFETKTTEFADVVFPAASFAETDGTYTNSDGLVQRVRQSISPVNQSKPDWMIIAQMAKALGVDFNFQNSANAVFREIAEKVPAYANLKYPLMKDETKPVQVTYPLSAVTEIGLAAAKLKDLVEQLPREGSKELRTPRVGHELFKTGNLTSKVAQFHLLEAGNPKPPTVDISPLYQITLDPNLRRPALAADALSMK